MDLSPSRLTLLLALALTLPATAQRATTESFQGRDLILFAPSTLPPTGTRSLVVVLHGGLGNASRIEGATAEAGLRMDAVAQKDGFLIAYLNGTPVTRRLGKNFLGWNAGGGCCGVPADTNVDDVAYITSAVKYLSSKYGIDPARVYGIGHSNGAMMTLRLVCETHLYAAAISISGPLNLPVQSCPAARGQRILSLHGADDRNVPIVGGKGSEGMSQVPFRSEQQTERVFTASGADFHLQVIPGADHKLENLDAAIQRTENVSIAEKAARFFGLSR